MNSISKQKTVRSTRRVTEHDLNANELVDFNELRKIKCATVKPFASNSEKDGFHTDRYKTKNSAWTPVLNPYSNSQIFQERLDLIGHWFSMWTDAQRKKFLSFILKRCTKSQMKYLKLGYFNHPLPIYHQDFTTVLPRFISLYIFSFLDPRSMCRAAQVSWHWKFLSEQDAIWMPKCQRFGWFLPYAPGVNEYGSWKNHYVKCTSTLDIDGPSQVKIAEVYGQFGVVPYDERNLKKKDSDERDVTKKNGKRIIYYRQDTRRPPWLDTDPTPKDLDDARKALLEDYNPNQNIPLDTVRRERLGLSTRPHQRSYTTPVPWNRGTRSSAKKRSASAEFTVDGTHMDRVEGEMVETKEPVSSSSLTLTEALVIESGVSPSVVEQPWPNAVPSSPVRRKDMTIGVHPSTHDSIVHTSRLTKESLPDSSPTVIFISSEIPASEVLLASVKLGTIAIPYEYESSTLEALLEKLKLELGGRQARCIGFFTAGDHGTMRLTQGQQVSSSTLHDPDMKFFWETVTTSALPKSRGGHVDIFLPLTETEPGMDLLVQMGLLTDSQITCPTGITGSYNNVDSEWLYEPDGIRPPGLYFNTQRLGIWANLLDYLQEATKMIREKLEPFFSEEHKLLGKRFIGEVTFKAFGLWYVKHLGSVANLLVETTNQLRMESTEYTKNEMIARLIENLKVEKEGVTRPMKTRRGTPKVSHGSDGDDSEDYDDDDNEVFAVGTGKSAGEKRTSIAREILSSEVEYMQALTILQDVFKSPLKAALSSNRAILSQPNINALFTDTDTLLSISGSMVDALSKRLDDRNWNSHQCLGDIFCKFTTQLRAYTNFLNNYPVTLATLQRCKEQNPQFRAFLKRFERQPNTKMQSFAELLLTPGKRLESYIDLLQRFLRYTPVDHVDRKNISQAIARIEDIASIFKQYDERLEREASLQELQKNIINCPVLAERGRRLICSEDIALLTPPTSGGKDIRPEYRVYQHTGDAGLYLFNDCLVVTALTFNFVPFKRLLRRNYKFQVCVSLKKLKLQNVPDTKHVKNAFVLVSPKRMWLCQASSWDQKLRWSTVLENTIVTAISRKDS